MNSSGWLQYVTLPDIKYGSAFLQERNVWNDLERSNPSRHQWKAGGSCSLDDLVFRFPGTTTSDCPILKLIDWIHDEGIGHHWMAGYGRVGEDIRQWARIAGSNICIVPRP